MQIARQQRTQADEKGKQDYPSFDSKSFSVAFECGELLRIIGMFAKLLRQIHTESSTHHTENIEHTHQGLENSEIRATQIADHHRMIEIIYGTGNDSSDRRHYHIIIIASPLTQFLHEMNHLPTALLKNYCLFLQLRTP